MKFVFFIQDLWPQMTSCDLATTFFENRRQELKTTHLYSFSKDCQNNSKKFTFTTTGLEIRTLWGRHADAVSKESPLKTANLNLNKDFRNVKKRHFDIQFITFHRSPKFDLFGNLWPRVTFYDLKTPFISNLTSRASFWYTIYPLLMKFEFWPEMTPNL